MTKRGRKFIYQENKQIYDKYEHYNKLQIDYTRFESNNDIMQELLNLLKRKESGKQSNINNAGDLNFIEE